MPRPRGRIKTARITVNLQPHEYATVLDLARKEDVPLAWLIRRAITDLIAKQEIAPQTLLPLSGFVRPQQ
jgi:hypothetical protein